MGKAIETITAGVSRHFTDAEVRRKLKLNLQHCKAESEEALPFYLYIQPVSNYLTGDYFLEIRRRLRENG
jgi:hypothetical protein